MPLYLTEDDVASLLTPADALPVIEESLRRLAAGEVDNQPRIRLSTGEGSLALMGAADRALGFAGVKTYTASSTNAVFVVVLFEIESGDCVALFEANLLGRLRTGAASGVAAKYLARSNARTLGVLGCGFQAEMQVACIREAVPSIERVVAYCRTESHPEAFCEKVGAEAAGTHREARGDAGG